MIRRRNFVAGASGLPLLTGLSTSVPAAMKDTRTEAQTSRVRPGDSAWPGPARWDELNRQTQGCLIKVQSPLTACQDLPGSATCTDVFKKLKNPYYIGDQPALTQTSGWVDAWTSQPSVYAVAAQTSSDVLAAVNFAREHHLRLV